MARSTLKNVDGSCGDQSDAARSAVAGAARTEVVHGRIDTDGSARWWLAVLVGTLVILPVGWLLSFAAALPFMLGTFFFALLGLIIGAITFRVAHGGRPYTTTAVVVGTTVIVMAGWSFSIYVEASGFPDTMAERALRDTRDLGDRTAEQFQVDVAKAVRAHLANQFAPGGAIGYVRWVVATGQIPRSEIPLVSKTLSVGQTGWVWLCRVGLSLGLLAFGVASQTLPLAIRVKSSNAPA